MDYIRINEAFTAIVIIPESVSTDTVTYTITLGSDKSEFATGSMTFVAGHAWKCSFTPNNLDNYILEANNTTLIIKKTEVYRVTESGSSSPVAPADNDLTTKAAFKTAFNITTETHDDLITATVTEVSEYIQKSTRINQYFAAAAYTEYYHGDGGDTLILRKLPVNSITSIHDDVDRAYATASLMDADDYMFDDESGIVTADGDVFSKGKKNIQVIYNAGYTSIPADVKLACEKLVMAEFCEKVTGVNTGVGDDMIYKPSKLRTEAGKMLEAYFKS